MKRSQSGANAEPNMFLLPSDNRPDVAFTGALVANASSRHGNAQRWTQIDLYRTEGGAWVVHTQGRTLMKGEITRHRVTICQSTSEVIDLVGHGQIGKDLYAQAGINAVVHIR